MFSAEFTKEAEINSALFFAANSMLCSSLLLMKGSGILTCGI